MQTPDPAQIGDTVLILNPFYVTGKVGVVCGREPHSDGESSIRWLIQVDSDQENILVSLRRNEFEVITPKLE
ncbi:hypothetical protein H6G97_42965 [Nostoc flagelliforme FACHB-838]|uniref:Uncharacterized protein n=1 Tax=Nostoc flagelliforme FACHB-838 TaxID=2692904 RepID=A0ABR8E3A4_9NOSO|nr:hypothetical protein [Nostoc flagelliforme]MBD2535760.1 hypothetical protein [Nostoc flagelliforme FACHB-838]